MIHFLQNFQFIHLDLATLICVLMWYSFLGWLYESTIFSLCEQGIFMNRGYFIGPYCPIYGVACVLNLYLLEGITSGFRIILLSGLSICAIEYITSYTLEKLFGTRYWDYSYYPLNINGRISVVSGFFFGIVSWVLIKWLHPLTLHMLSHVSMKSRVIAAIGFTVIFVFDATFTIVSMCNLNKKCKALYDAWDEHVENGLDILNAKKDSLNRFTIVRKGKNIVVRLKGVNRTFVELETRYLKVFPQFKHVKYGVVIEKLKDTIRRNK